MSKFGIWRNSFFVTLAILVPLKIPAISPVQVPRHVTDNSAHFEKPEILGTAKFKILFEPKNQVFPAAIVSLVEVFKKHAEPQQADKLGIPNGALSIKAQGSHPNTQVRIIVFPNRLVSAKSEATYSLENPGNVYEIFPLVTWDFDKLTALDQPTNETFKIGIQVDGKFYVEKYFQPRIRSISDCLLEVSEIAGEKKYDLRFMFGAFVNENNPIIDHILREAKENAIRARPLLRNANFTGYQEGEAQVLEQVFMLWFLFQMKHFVYSSITLESGSTKGVVAQHVRSIQDSYAATQANCVDGSVLFASILYKIGIFPFLVLKPGHCYLGFFGDEKKTKPYVLETTALRYYQARSTNPLAEYLGSRKSFDRARQEAVNTLKTDWPQYRAKNPGFITIDIDELRKYGVVPINR